MFASKVFAADVAVNQPSIGASFANFVPLILISVVFYFFIIRPHHKKSKRFKKMIDQVKRGDTVVASGGIIGVVNKIDEANAQFVVEVAPKVEIKVLRTSISEVLSKEAETKLTSEKGKIEKDDKKNKNQQDRGKKGQENKSKNA